MINFTDKTLGRREALRLLGGTALAGGAATLASCGSGGATSDASANSTNGAASSSSSASSTSSSSGSSSSASSASSSSSTSTLYADAPNPWVWANAGVSTMAKVPTLGDFVEVIASGSVTYSFHVTTTSTTTDPITGVTSNTSSQAVLAPYFMGKFLVTNANWKAFCNAVGSSYYPTTSRTAGQYWSGGAYPVGKEDHPVFFVSLTQAQAYCAWLATQISGYDFYVPTEGEWEYAALGSNTSYNYPFGVNAGISYNTATGAISTPFNCNAVCTAFVLHGSGLTTLTYYHDSQVATLGDGVTPLTNDVAVLTAVLSENSSGGVTGWQYDSSNNSTWADFANSDQFAQLVQLYGGYSTPVGAYPAGASWCGCLDMAGNAYEWTTTLNTASNGAESGSSVNVIKGGSWYATANSARSTGRGEGRVASGAYHSVGFRVAARRK